MSPRGLQLGLVLLVGAQGPTPPDLERERAEFARWLGRAATSPFRAVVQHPIGAGLTLGPPASDVPLDGLGSTRIEDRGARLTLTVEGAARPLTRNRLVPLGRYAIMVSGPSGRSVVTVYGERARDAKPPAYYPYAPGLRFALRLEPVRSAKSVRLLAPDGTEVEATEAGTVRLAIGGTAVALRVFRLPTGDAEESELEIYFRDRTNGRGTYPAGRFVSLVPAPDGSFVLDFNRARNPYCAYSTVFACPAPWRGNAIAVPIEAGEKYLGGGLSNPPI